MLHTFNFTTMNFSTLRFNNFHIYIIYFFFTVEIMCYLYQYIIYMLKKKFNK